MIASLPMYDGNPPRVQQFWHAVAERLAKRGVGPVPVSLTWPHDFFAHWLEPALLLSQACGYPLVTTLRDKVQLVGAFHYGVPGCAGALCQSQLVVRDSDPARTLEQLRGRRVAYNGTESQSGYNSLRSLLAPLSHDGSFFKGHVETGSHEKSVLAVRDGLADVASIDCISLAAFARYTPAVCQGIRVLGQSAVYPGLPLISARATNGATLAALREALGQVVRDPLQAPVCADLFITGFEALEFSAYDVCTDMRNRAIARGYPSL